jgi:hypothetical protein
MSRGRDAGGESGIRGDRAGEARSAGVGFRLLVLGRVTVGDSVALLASVQPPLSSGLPSLAPKSNRTDVFLGWVRERRKTGSARGGFCFSSGLVSLRSRETFERFFLRDT